MEDARSQGEEQGEKGENGKVRKEENDKQQWLIWIANFHPYYSLSQNSAF